MTTLSQICTRTLMAVEDACISAEDSHGNRQNIGELRLNSTTKSNIIF